MTLTTYPFDRGAAIEYARNWALDRNPEYVDFSDMGGDCTSFVSQILMAGGAVMNKSSRETGWYFRSLSDRSYSWSGVPFMYQFLTTNQGLGPFGHVVPSAEVQPGDIIQLRFYGNPQFSHSLFVTQVGEPPTPYNVLIAAHTLDSIDRPLATYSYVELRVIRIDGVRKVAAEEGEA